MRANAAIALAAAALALGGCALTAEPRFGVYRGGFPQGSSAKSRPWQNEFSSAVSVRLVPVRKSGTLLGGEIETSACLHLQRGCAHVFDLRNGSLLVGYSWLPGDRGRYLPGFDALVVSGIGEPPGPLAFEGTRFRFGVGGALTFPIAPTDIGSGYVVLGTAFELVLESRAGMWSPPALAPRSEVLFENTVGLAIRVRAFSDMLAREGYPRPTRSE